MKYISRYLDHQRALVEESFLLFEDKEGKNINRAEKWIKQNQPGILGKTVRAEIHGQIQDVVITPRFVTQEVRNLVDNVKLADCKFLVGATRLYFDSQKNPHDMVQKMSKLNKILKIICISHADEYDYDLNGMSLDQLEEKFGKIVQAEIEADKRKLKSMSMSLKKRDDYKFVIIDTFEEAEKYGQYTEWCVTHQRDMYDTYTKNGLGRFYFCLQDGFEDIPKEETEGCPLDRYGKSMIAVLVGDDGGLWHCTCRWNHSNGGNDNIMTTEQISRFFGVDFYETFKPRSAEEVWNKLLDNRSPDDGFCKVFGCIKTWNDEDEIYAYYKLIDGKIVKFFKVDYTIAWIDGKFVTMKDGELVDARPTSIGDSAFSYCSSLTSITIPGSVKSIGDFAFSNCTSLTSIAIPGSVKSIGDFAFSNCRSLKSIVIPYSVKSIGEYAFSWCTSITSISIPDSVKSIGNGAFDYCTSLKSIVIPSSVESIGDSTFFNCGGFFDCKNLKSIVFKGKTLEEVQSMAGYPWNADESIIKAEL